MDLPCGSENHRPPHDFKQSANSLVVTTFGPLPPWLGKIYRMGISHLCRSSSGFWWAGYINVVKMKEKAMSEGERK